jgi:hypothetical protein
MVRRDPLVDGREQPDDRHRAPDPSGADLPTDVPGLLEADDPAPERRGRERAGPARLRQDGLDPSHLAHSGRLTAGGDPDRPDDPRLDRDPPQPVGNDPVPKLPEGHSEELPPKEVDRPSDAAPLLDRTVDDPVEEGRRGGLAQRLLGAVGDDRP